MPARRKRQRADTLRFRLRYNPGIMERGVARFVPALFPHRCCSRLSRNRTIRVHFVPGLDRSRRPFRKSRPGNARSIPARSRSNPRFQKSSHSRGRSFPPHSRSIPRNEKSIQISARSTRRQDRSSHRRRKRCQEIKSSCFGRLADGFAGGSGTFGRESR